MLRRLAVLASTAFALGLAACGPVGYEAHVFDWPERVGQSETRIVAGHRVLVRYALWPEVRDRCAPFMPGTDVLGCALWREPADGPIDRPVLLRQVEAIPAGYDCVVHAPPNARILAHELRHCREGAWHTHALDTAEWYRPDPPPDARAAGAPAR